MRPERVVIAGYGMAGARLAVELRARGGQPAITVFGAEPEPAYNRVLLSALLAGRVDETDVALPGVAEQDVDVRTGVEVVAIDRGARKIIVDGGGHVAYDHLVLATGSRAMVPPLAGVDPDRLPRRVAVFRTLADCRRILTAADGVRSAIVLGGGPLGLEAARGLAGRGIRVRVVHAVGHLMERQLDPGASAVLVATLSRLGITTHLDATASGVVAGDGAVVLALDDGRRLAADLLVISCGVRPETRLAVAAGLAVQRGIVVDDRLRTSDPAISAIGDCAEFGGVVSGLVAPAWEQARVLAAALTGDPRARYRPLPPVTRLKVDGIDLAAMGAVDAGSEQVTFADPARGTYARLAIESDRLAGAILLGDNPAVGAVIQLFDRGSPVPHDRRSLLLGRSASGAVAASSASPALIPDAAIVCQCNAVTKGTLVDSWRGGNHTLEQTVTATRATTGCGTCREAVENIIDWLSRTQAPPSR